jgi:hypothetical protein
VTAIPSFAAANFFQATVKIPFWNISQFSVGQFDRVDTQPSIIHIECTMGNVIVAWWRFDTNVHTSPGFNQSGPTTITTASSSPPSSETPVKSRIPGGGRYQPITAALIVELYNVGGGPSNPGNLVVDVGCHVVYQPR